MKQCFFVQADASTLAR